jgi:hypothetical protein
MANLKQVENDVKTDVTSVEADATSFFTKTFSGKVVAIVGAALFVVGLIVGHVL